MLPFCASNVFCLLFALATLILGMGKAGQAADWSPNHRDSRRTSDAPNRRQLPPRPAPKPAGIPGEFEQQAALVLSWKSEEASIIDTLLEIGALASRRGLVIVLVSSPEERRDAERAFGQAGVLPGRMQFLYAPVDTIWARDFGPVVVRTPHGTAHFVDSDYDDGDRPQDDNVPPLLAAEMGMQSVRTLLTIEGGNLLSNGAGLCVTTSKTVADNVLRGYEHQQIAPLFRKSFHCQEVAVLEPLVGEPTGHVDMFATFTSQGTVVVGAFDPVVDPINAAVLDRNAHVLSKIQTPRGPLRVERIPMPRLEDDVWRTHTNVLYFNGLLLVPVYPGAAPWVERQALATYRQLLPGWEIRGIDCADLIQLGGAVHCVTLNLAEMAHVPGNQPGRRPLLNPARNDVPLFPAEWEENLIGNQEDAPRTFVPGDPANDSPAGSRGLSPFPLDGEEELHRRSRADTETRQRMGSSARRTREPTMFAHPEKSSFAADEP